MANQSLTEKAAAVQTTLESRLFTLYTRQDLERQLQAVRSSLGRSDELSQRLRLHRMLKAGGVACRPDADLREIREKILSSGLPRRREDWEDRILYLLYAHLMEFPSPADYMGRLVDRLSSKEDPWTGDSLRLRILRQFVKYGHCLCYWETRKDGSEKKVRVHIYGGEAYLRRYLQDRGMILGDEEVWDHADDLQEDVFDVLAGAPKEKTKKLGTYGLLKVCEDLAQGSFRVGGTRRALYLFAMVYGMTYYPGEEKPESQRSTDVEVNLFWKYYTNNLLRLLDGDRASDFELPSGQGINYKNPAELVCLYYIRRDLEPWEKVARSHRMIRQLSAAAADPVPEEDPGTQGFRSWVLCGPEDTVLNLERSAFGRFLLQRYQWTHARNTNEFQLRQDQNSAWKEFEKCLRRLRRLEVRPEDLCGLSFTDAFSYGEHMTEKQLDQLKRGGHTAYIHRDTAHRLGRVLRSMDRYLGRGDFTVDPKSGRVTNRRVTGPETMSRSALTAVFYYRFQAQILQKAGTGDRGLPVQTMTLAECFQSFKTQIDPILERASYQPFSSSELFDVLTVLSAYYSVTADWDMT